MTTRADTFYVGIPYTGAYPSLYSEPSPQVTEQTLAEFILALEKENISINKDRSKKGINFLINNEIKHSVIPYTTLLSDKQTVEAAHLYAENIEMHLQNYNKIQRKGDPTIYGPGGCDDGERGVQCSVTIKDAEQNNFYEQIKTAFQETYATKFKTPFDVLSKK